MSADLRGTTIGIIGAGRVGSVLGAALADAGYWIVSTLSSRTSGMHRDEGGTPTEIIDAADLVIFAVPDDVLSPLVGQLTYRPGQIVAPARNGPSTRCCTPPSTTHCGTGTPP